MCALYNAYTGEREWKDLRDRLQAPCYLSRVGHNWKIRTRTQKRAWKEIRDSLQVPSYLSKVDHNWKIRTRTQRTDIGKYSFVNRSIADWNQLPKGAIWRAHGNAYKFKTRVRKT